MRVLTALGIFWGERGVHSFNQVLKQICQMPAVPPRGRASELSAVPKILKNHQTPRVVETSSHFHLGEVRSSSWGQDVTKVTQIAGGKGETGGVSGA